MKSESLGSRGTGTRRRAIAQGAAEMTPESRPKTTTGLSMGTRLPLVWMDPMNWRLPSGKALAEFALQSGFLAPTVIGNSLSLSERPKTASGQAESWQLPTEARAEAEIRKRTSEAAGARAPRRMR